MPRTVNAPPKAVPKPSKVRGKDLSASSGPVKVSKHDRRSDKSSSSSTSSKRKKGRSAKRGLPEDQQRKPRRVSRRVSLARKIRRTQKLEHKLGKKGYLPRSPMVAEIRDLMQIHGNDNMKLAKQAAVMIQLGAEFKVKQILNNAKYFTVNANRKTMTTADVLMHLQSSEPSFYQRYSDELVPNEN